MKTTIELSDDLAARAKALAQREGTTLRAIIEHGLRMKLSASASSGFKLEDKSVEGKGLQAEFRDKTWEEVRAASYKHLRP